MRSEIIFETVGFGTVSVTRIQSVAEEATNSYLKMGLEAILRVLE